MYLSLLATLLCLFCFTKAGQQLIDFQFRGNFCSIAGKDDLVNVIPYQSLSSQDHGSHSASRLHKSIRAGSISSPWTREPKCIGGTETYCVYTNEKFANGRGISFFTTATIAERVTALPAFTEKEIHVNFNVFDNPPWEIRQTPGRGKGLFATRTLHRGDLILADTPVGVYHSDAFPSDYTLGYTYLRMAFEQLPKSTKDLVLSMATHNQGDPIMERVNTNAFAGDFGGAPHFLLYPETAKMNHDCRPNAMYYYNSSTLVHSTHASRTIHPGEEITITYINILQPRSTRQENLKEIWGFECACSLCSSESRTSDFRIQRIIDIQTALSDWGPTSPGTPSMAEELLTLYKEEHLHSALGMGHMLAALEYNAIEDTKKAKMHGRKAIEAGMVTSRSDDTDIDEVKALLRDPVAHWSYLARKAR